MVSILELHFAMGNLATTGMGFQGDAGPLLWEDFPTAHVIIAGRRALGVPALVMSQAPLQDIPVTGWTWLHVCQGVCCVVLFLVGHCARGTRQPLPREFSQGENSLPGAITAPTGRSSWMYIRCDIVLGSKP